MAWLLAILLAHGHGPAPWVEFEVCQLDFATRPPIAQRSRDHSTLMIRADRVHAVSVIHPKPDGLDCVTIGAMSGQQVHVVGTQDDVIRKLSY